MKTFLVKIPPDNQSKGAAFNDLLIQLWETMDRDPIALEIVALGQNIAFCFTGSDTACRVLAGQIYGLNAETDIVAVPDFLIKFKENSRFLSSELSLKRPDIFPLKDYTHFDGDSLGGLLTVLAQCEPGELMIVQIVIRPERDTGMHNLRLNYRRSYDKFRHIFRFKYWFKKGLGSHFNEHIKEKVGRRMFRVNVRVGAGTFRGQIDPEPKLRALLGAMSNFNTLDLNQFKMGGIKQDVSLQKFRKRHMSGGFLLSTRELATLFHLPNEREVPNIVHVLSRRGAPPTNLPTDPSDPSISFFATTNFRNQHTPFGLKRIDRRRHSYVVGKSGSGKSKLLELLIKSDIEAGKGVGVLDPHGDLVDNVLQFVPEERVQDVVLFDPSDLNFPASFNPLEQVPEELKIRVTIGFIEIFKKLFGTNWSPRLEHVLRYTTLALLDTPGTTVLSILKMLSDKNYRQMIVRNINDNVVKNFWVNEFAGWSERYDNEAITPLLNKVGQFVATNMIRHIVGQPVNRFDFRSIMDSEKILLVKVSKGILGEENAALLGAMVVTKIYQAAMSRADTPEAQRKDFYLYVDEFHNFATETFDEILTEARKYRLNLTIANQFLGQLDDRMRKTVFGNTGSLISFRVSGDDAKSLASEFTPRFNERDVLNLGVQDFLVKMSVDGEVREAFSGRTLRITPPEHDYVAECIEYSRSHYARPLDEVKQILKAWEENKFDASGAQTAKIPASKSSQPEAGGSKQPEPAPEPASSSLDDDVEFEEPLL